MNQSPRLLLAVRGDAVCLFKTDSQEAKLVIRKFSTHHVEKYMTLLVPPFSRETAIQKVRLAENGWNTCDPHKVCLSYTEDSVWRNRAEFITGRAQIVEFLSRKWAKELDYRLIKELWAFDGNRIAVRFAYEWHDHSGNWFRSYGNENWEFDENGLMHHRHASINDLPLRESERLYHWERSAPRPENHPGLTELGL